MGIDTHRFEHHKKLNEDNKMIISSKYAKHLVATKKAQEIGIINDNDQRYMAIDRIDFQRTDHYLLKGNLESL